MDMNFTKAHHFSINGGNFGTINGGVNNYALTPGSLASQPARLGIDSSATGLLSLPPSQGNDAGGAAIHSVPSTPATSYTDISPASSTNNTPSPTHTNSTVSSESDYDFSSGRSSAASATGVGEQRRPGTFPPRPQPVQQPDPNLLTPLTDTLGLRRFTPGSQAGTLSPYQTPQQAPTEFPGSPQYTSQVHTPLLLPQLPRTPQPANQVAALPSTPQPLHSTQFPDHASPSTLHPPSHPLEFPAYRASSTSPNRSEPDSVFRAARNSPIPPYPQNSPPSFDSSPMSPGTATMPHSAADSDDPSVIFQRLRAGTKGYANPLPHSNVFEYTPSPSLSARTSLPRQAEVPQARSSPELAAPQSSQHWTSDIISDWTNHVHEGDPSTRPVHDYQNQTAPQHRGSRPLPSPPVSQPQVPVNSFSYPQQPHYPNYADVYRAPPFYQQQYHDNQTWPVFAPVMHPPHPFPPQHYPTHPNRLQYNQTQPPYHAAASYGNAPSFPMPLKG